MYKIVLEFIVIFKKWCKNDIRRNDFIVVNFDMYIKEERFLRFKLYVVSNIEKMMWKMI